MNLLINIIKKPKLIIFCLIGVYIGIITIENYVLKSTNKDLRNEILIHKSNVKVLEESIKAEKEVCEIKINNYETEIDQIKQLLKQSKPVVKEVVKLKNCEVKIEEDNKTNILNNLFKKL